MNQPEATFYAALLAAVIGLANILLQWRNNHRTGQTAYYASVQTRLLAAHQEILGIEKPHFYRHVPDVVYRFEEKERLADEADALYDIALRHGAISDRLTADFDKDVWDTVLMAVNDFRRSHGAYVDSKETADQDMESTRIAVTEAYLVSEVVRHAIEHQLERVAHQLRTGRRLYYVPVYDLDFTGLDTRIRKTLNPNWVDWP